MRSPLGPDHLDAEVGRASAARFASDATLPGCRCPGLEVSRGLLASRV